MDMYRAGQPAAYSSRNRYRCRKHKRSSLGVSSIFARSRQTRVSAARQFVSRTTVTPKEISAVNALRAGGDTAVSLVGAHQNDAETVSLLSGPRARTWTERRSHGNRRK